MKTSITGRKSLQNYLHTGHNPEEEFRQLAKRHSRHNRWAHGVKTASSNASRHIGHSPCSPLLSSSTTSWTKATDGSTSLPSFSRPQDFPPRKRLASLFRSEYCAVSPRLYAWKKQGTVIKNMTTVIDMEALDVKLALCTSLLEMGDRNTV